MFKSWVQKNFTIKPDVDGSDMVEVMPKLWVNFDFLISVFKDADLSFESLEKKVGSTGYEVILKDWKDKGIID